MFSTNMSLETKLFNVEKKSIQTGSKDDSSIVGGISSFEIKPTKKVDDDSIVEMIEKTEKSSSVEVDEKVEKSSSVEVDEKVKKISFVETSEKLNGNVPIVVENDLKEKIDQLNLDEKSNGKPLASKPAKNFDKMPKEKPAKTLPKAPFCNIHLIGNSHLAIHRNLQHEFVKLLHPNTLVENYSVGGGRVDARFKRDLKKIVHLEVDYPSMNKSFVVVMTGDNDLRQGIEPATLAKDLVKELETIPQLPKNVLFVVCGIINSPSLVETQVQTFNETLKLSLEESKVSTRFLDLNEKFQKEVARIKSKKNTVFYEFQKDKVHLSMASNNVVAVILAKALNPLIHKEFNGKIPRVRSEIRSRFVDPVYRDYIRMKGIFRKTYDDLLERQEQEDVVGIVGLNRNGKPKGYREPYLPRGPRYQPIDYPERDYPIYPVAVPRIPYPNPWI
jgi:lysophospholipase L1-like esterase